jgi:hypothetical protein
MLFFRHLREPHLVLLGVLLGILFPVLFRRSLNFLLEILILVALYRPLHLTCRFPLVDKVVRFHFLLPNIIHLLHNPRLEHNFRLELHR